MKTYKGFITELKEDEVFVFGANLGGFHGAGSAGFASFGEAGNKWRDYKYDQKPNGWKGFWNVKGVGKGPQVGTEGKSYALPTVRKIGSAIMPLEEIKGHITELREFMLERPHLKFYVAQDAVPGLCGHTPQDMADAYSIVKDVDNVYFKEEFAALIK